MKKTITILLALVLLFSFNISTFAASQPTLIVNGKIIKDVEIKSIKDTTYLPLRAIASTLGVQVSWHQSSGTVIVGSGKADGLKKGKSSRLMVNGKVVTGVDVPNYNGVTFVPLRAVAQILGAKVDWNQSTRTITITDGASSSSALQSIKQAMNQHSKGLNIPTSSETVLKNNHDAFFKSGRDLLSLDKLAKATNTGDIERNVKGYNSSIVNATFVEIDEITEVKTNAGQVVTVAVGHTGGAYRELTEQWEDSHYILIYFLGTETSIKKGTKTTVNGIPVGQQTIELTNAMGVEFTQPLSVIIAGNFLSSSKEYDLRVERSNNNPGEIIFGDDLLQDLDKEKKLWIEASLDVEGLTVSDLEAGDLKISTIQLGNYQYTAPSAGVVVEWRGTMIPYSEFRDSSGNTFEPVVNNSYPILITFTNGQKYSDFNAYYYGY